MPMPMSNPTLQDAITDSLARFILPLPAEEFKCPLRLMYHMELAFWHLSDFYCDVFPEIPKLNFKSFTLTMFNSLKCIPQFSEICKNYETMESIQLLCSQYRKHTRTIPVCGCIILSPDMKYCLAVRSWSKNIWNYPKGKINQGETDVECAIREVKEETGFDVSKLINENLFIEDNPNATNSNNANSNDRRTKLFIIQNVNRFSTVFKTQTRKEIGAIEWIPIRFIPFRRQKVTKQNRPIWALTRFERRLRNWISTQKHRYSCNIY
jgi:mRNA-decapping enzyme subunit 2